MKRWQLVCIPGLLLALLPSHFYLSAFAQFGVGFGAMNWGGGGGSWFGVSLWPGQRRSQSPPRRTESPSKTNGYLEGNVTVHTICPPDQPDVACPVIPDALSDITITATPAGMSQWLSSQPDTHGHYRMMLSPGSYNISVQHAYKDRSALDQASTMPRLIIIQSGQTNRQNFQVNLPLQ